MAPRTPAARGTIRDVMRVLLIASEQGHLESTYMNKRCGGPVSPVRVDRMQLPAPIARLCNLVERHPIGAAVLGGLSAVAAYDTFSGQVEQITGKEIPTLREVFGWSVTVGGSLLPWWGWVIMLLATFNVILLWHFRGGRPSVFVQPQHSVEALQQQMAALVASATATTATAGALRASPEMPPSTPHYAVDLTKQIEMLRAIKLHERRDHLLAELNSLIAEGRRVFDGDREHDDFPVYVGLWRTQLKNTMAWADQLVPGIDDKVHQVNANSYVEVGELQLANLEEVTERLEWGFQDLDRL